MWSMKGTDALNLRKRGRDVGSKLLERHRIIFEFLECLGVKENYFGANRKNLNTP